MAILLQSLALKLGIATRRDLAQMCRKHYSKPKSLFLWIRAEVAIVIVRLRCVQTRTLSHEPPQAVDIASLSGSESWGSVVANSQYGVTGADAPTVVRL